MRSKFSLGSLLSSNVMAWMLVLCVLVSIIATILVAPHEFLKSRIYVFISILASVAVLFIGLSLLISSFIFERQEDTTRRSITKESIDKLWLFPNQLLANSTHAHTQFLKSFYTNNPHLFAVNSNGEEQSALAVLQEQNIAIVMIQAWEDYLTMRKLDQTGDTVWLNNFLQWAQSPYLKEYFGFLKFNFKKTTIELGDILFRYAATLPIPTQNPELYPKTVQKMLADPEMIDLLNKA